MNIKKIMTVGIMSMHAMISFAAQITNVTAKQRSMWNGKVDIAYEVVGDVAEGVPPGKMPVLLVEAADRVNGAKYVSIAKALSGDTGTAEGMHNVVWDLDKQGVKVKSDDVVFTVAYTNKPKMYCVVDLSDGAEASSYPVSYLAEAPSGVWADEYKTTKLVLRLVEPGSFKMCGQSDVTLTKAFYCGVFEVTQKQYELVTGNNPSQYKGNMRPVECVSWNAIRGDSSLCDWPNTAKVDPNSFMGKLRERTGINFDLPTEAQWKYACWAGKTNANDNGRGTVDDLSRVGRYSGNNADGKGGYSEHTTVGSYKPNDWGLYDMYGNVWEWCLDWYGTLSENMTDPAGPSSGANRVLCGGGWFDIADYIKPSYRYGIDPSKGFLFSGFRLVGAVSGDEHAQLRADGNACDGSSCLPVAVDTQTAERLSTLVFGALAVLGVGAGVYIVAKRRKSR